MGIAPWAVTNDSYIVPVRPGFGAVHATKGQVIQPGKLQQNVYIERYNRTVRYDWLAALSNKC